MDASAISEGHKYAHLYNYSGSNKAGMDGMDKDKQAQIIYELSKDSAYFKRAAKLDAEADVKVQGLKKTLLEVKGPLEEKLRKEVQRMVLDLEPRRSFKRICCVLDMDMFFAAVEIRDKPHLKDLPVAVGGMSMISTANYVARKYGVRAAMPGFIAKKLCPQLVFVDMNFDKYRHISEQVKEIIGEYDPEFTSHSLDEVYFDLTNAATDAWRKRHVFNNNATNVCAPTTMSECGSDIDIFALRAIAVELLQDIRRRITEVTGGLTCSAGLANNHYLAKIGADVNKPDGQFELPPTREAVMDFVTTLATRKVTGIGKVTERMLDSLLGVKTMGQVREHLPKLLHTVSPILFQFLLRTCMGIGSHEGDDSVAHSLEVSEKKAYMRKSLGCERTFASKGISDPTELYARLRKICHHVADDMASENLWAKAVTLKLKNVEFELITRIASSAQYFQSVETIENLAKTLLDEALPVNIRLMGVSVSKFKPPEASEADPKQRNMLMFLKAKGNREDDQAIPQEEGGSSRSTNSVASCTGASVKPAATNDIRKSDHSLEVSENEKEDSEVEILDDDLVASDFPTTCANSYTVPDRTSTRTSPNQPPQQQQQQQQQQQVHECPVCGAQVPGMLARFNLHLDRCLGLDRSDASAVSIASAPKKASSAKAKKTGCGISASGAAETSMPPLKAPVNALFASFNSTTAVTVATSSAAAAGSQKNASHTTSAPSSLKRPQSSSSSSNTSSASARDSQRVKASRREPLALEITDYFTFK